MSATEKKYRIKLDARTTVMVNEYQLFRERWLKHFGSVEAVLEFIKNYEKEEQDGH